ncbi:NAD(P)-binding protein [Polyplosphaeria fusca]|uniref:NAD(P)-binding protein n=1 Tax=Polyplosphaeria fusca TaxID=682080 RepID=A0A9P4QQF5_9PLEO|nr:NAD(P)-binding protein [Polyplosphaeria fusca]
MAQLVWLVTGCSSGFGEQFVHSILARGDKVIATARRPETLQGLEKAGASVLPLDITSSQRSISATINQAIEILSQIDVLINNAGFFRAGTWEDLEHEDWLAQFDTNVFGTIKTTKALLPHFRQRKSGTNVFISSLSGWIGHPICSPYAGSKFALEGIVEGLWRETASLGIRTLLIEPGRFRTKFLSDGNRKGEESAISDYSFLSSAVLGGIAKEDQAQPGDPVKLVEIIVDLVRKEGVAQDKEVPFRVPLGIDSYDAIKEKCEETLKMLEEWKGVIQSTNYDE